MPEIEDASYSRSETVRAVRGYYRFLTTMYLDSSHVAEPPSESGWPQITYELFREFRKTEEVVALLRCLPYIKGAPQSPWCYRPHAGACIQFHDYTSRSQDLLREPLSEEEGEDLRDMTEDCLGDQIPPHVVGLISGDTEESFLLDTKLGIVHWTDCPVDIRYTLRISTKGIYSLPGTGDSTEDDNATQERGNDITTTPTTIGTQSDEEALGKHLAGTHLQSSCDGQRVELEVEEKDHSDDDDLKSSDGSSEATDERDPDIIEQILDDVCDDWCPENEQDWRGDSGKWAIADFFEVLKLQFRTLNWVPLSDKLVMDVGSASRNERKSRMLSEVQQIWREHGWPVAETKGTFDKAKCLAHVRQFLGDKYPEIGETLDMYP